MGEKDNFELLEERLAEALEYLKTLKPGTDDYRKAAENVAKLYEVKIAQEKAESEAKLQERKEANNELYREQDRIDASRKEKKDTLFRSLQIALTAAGGIGTIVYKWVWSGRGLEFEKTGAFTSKVGNFLRNWDFKFK